MRSAIQQSIAFNLYHRIGEAEPLAPGFRDAGRGTGFDEAGELVGRARREIILFKAPGADPLLNDAIEAARAGTVELASLDARVLWLKDHVAALMPVNDPAENSALLEKIAGKDGYAGTEISLDQLIEAGTGVCRHRSLLFKVIADALTIPAALVRGNYKRHGVDQGRSGAGGRGGHAWNEALVDNGERLIVDVMHGFITPIDHPRLASYADVRDVPLYPEAVAAVAAADAAAQAPVPEWRLGDAGVIRSARTVAAAPWIIANSPSAGRSGYLFTDTMQPDEQAGVRAALHYMEIAYDDYATSLGGGGSRRPVIRIRGNALSAVNGLGARLGGIDVT